VKPNLAAKPRKRLPYRKWKKPKDVERLIISHKKLTGGGGEGQVYIGRLKFKGGEWRRVAVKRFFDPLSDKKAKDYQTMIKKLVKEGVPLPKTGTIKIEGEWVQVMELFTKQGKTKIVDWHKTEKEVRPQMAEIFAKTVNAGYLPGIDYIDFRTKNIEGREKVVPFISDFGHIIGTNKLTAEERVSRAVEQLTNTIGIMETWNERDFGDPSRKEMEKLFPFFLKQLKRKYRPMAKKYIERVMQELY